MIKSINRDSIAPKSIKAFNMSFKFKKWIGMVGIDSKATRVTTSRKRISGTHNIDRLFSISVLAGMNNIKIRPISSWGKRNYIPSISVQSITDRSNYSVHWR